jgi:hypothetical protein
MAEHGWQRNQRVTVPASGSIAVPLPPSRPVLETLTIWAVSGLRNVTNMTFQPRINRRNFGSSVNVAGVPAANLIYSDGGDTQENRIMPVGLGSIPNPYINGDTLQPGPDPFDFDILITSTSLVNEDVTLYFAAVGRDGGAS